MVEVPFNESDIVDDLRELSNEFDRFYQEERLKYDFPIQWIWKPELPEGNKAKAGIHILKTGEVSYRIYFRDFPEIGDAVIFAHEIEHLIRDKENKSPKIKTENKEFIHIPTALMSMLEDSLVDAFLFEKYNFDLFPSYEKTLKRSKQQLSKLDEEKRDPAAKLEIAFNLTNRILCRKLLKDQDTNKDWINFLVEFKSKCPKIWKMSEYISAIIHDNGRETREEQKAVFDGILEKFKDYKFEI